jgi:hypothetical protein
MAYTDIDKPTDYFNTVLYTGNGTTDRAITGVGYQPDFVWIKNRTTDFGSRLLDSVRGATKELFSNVTNAETTNTEGLKSFDSDGFTLGNHGGTNENSSNFVAWNWLASNTTASNTDGSITSTVSANTTSGFSIVSYTGTGSASTIGHGLGSAPKMVICKTRSTSGVWLTWHTGISINGQIQLQSTDAVYNPGTGLYWNSTLPTSSVFSVGTSGSVNGSGTTYIAYCFAEKQGYSKFGKYVGSGSASSGTFVYTGFKPAFYIIKRTDTTGSWIIKDNLRPGYNVNGSYLVANDNLVESTGSGNVATDEYSNGFKIRGTSSSLNTSGGTYIYMAFAENPFVTSTGIPTTAR